MSHQIDHGQVDHRLAAIQPGQLLVIDRTRPGRLRVSDQPYDQCVAGVVSGAGGLNTGLGLSRRDVLEGEAVDALVGRVYCWCDATLETVAGPIAPGDWLTTAASIDHAMKVCNEARAGGAVVGKAMTGHKDGRGLVLVLVNLQ